MKKRNKIIFWIATIWLSLGMTATGIVQLLGLKEETAFISKLGYPDYFLPMIGVAKILGVIAILIPKFPLVKEWAYAGFFFLMTGAAFSHIATGDYNGMGGCLLLLALTCTSWLMRPAERKPIFITQKSFA